MLEIREQPVTGAREQPRPAVQRAPFIKIGTGPGEINPESIAAALREKIRGEVRFSPGDRAMYATDGSNYRQVPIGVVVPRDEEDVIRAMAVCRGFGAPVLARGGGTSLAGQCCNVAVVFDFSKYMHRIVELNPDDRYAWVEPGIVNDGLRNAAKPYDLTFGPDPATHNRCTIGGNIGNNSCGIHSVMAGRTAENIEELEILTYDGHRMRVGRTSQAHLEEIIRGGGAQGEIYGRLRDLRDRYARQIRERYPKIPRRVSGYNLDKLLPEAECNVAQALVGSESTCVLVLRARCRLVYSPPERTLVVLGYRDVFDAADHIMEVLAHNPIGLEGLDAQFIDDMKVKGLHPRDLTLMPEGGGWLLVEFGGSTPDESLDRAHRMIDDLRRQPAAPHIKLFDDKDQERMVWEVREAGLGATARVPGQKDNWEGWEDSAVPPQFASRYLRDLRQLFNKYGYHGSLYGHFGDGCIHTRIDFDLKTAAGIRHYRSFISEAVDTVLSYGGSLSGEHGDGQSRGEFLPRMFGEELMEAQREFKRIWDPAWKMNPGKKIDAMPLDSNLRYGVRYNPPDPATHFHYADDHHSFARAMERCVGVGECRRHGGGTMCPSYMATLEEKHSTRGRARALFEMLEGDPLEGGWKSEYVKDALDLCLSCKGCKGDCPVNVDMATYKAEFLSHYYDGRIRPRNAYASGLIHWWARAASHAPALANLFTQAPGLSAAAKFAAGYAHERHLPPFAYQTFREWFAKRPAARRHGHEVMLWADTFSNYFQPEIAKAAVEVLEDAGWRVTVPRQPLCCGRPLYDYGMLDTAKALLRRDIRALEPQIRRETPIVVLEPSCASVFRDEMTDLLWGNEDASRLRGQVFLLSEFLADKTPGYHPPRMQRKALAHIHCHHKSILGTAAERRILDEMGLSVELPATGCCGMAGAFGYEKGDHYDVAIACGERVLLPAVRHSSNDTVVIADGFSCREQIEQTTGRRALHLSQVLAMARDGERGRPAPADYPERAYPARLGMTTRQKILTGARWAAVGAAVAALWWGWRRT